jgi:hypothetical protein
MVLVRWFLFVDEKDAWCPPIGERCHLPYAMKEVCQTTTVKWAKSSVVVNICFIFYLNAIQKGFVSCGGMEQVYYIRFQKGGGDLLPLKERDFKPFYWDPLYPFQEGYPEAIWLPLFCLKLQLSKELSCGGVWDGRTKSAKLNGVPPSFFGYLKDQSTTESDINTQYKKIRTSHPRKHIFDNLAARQIRMNTLAHQIRVLEETKMDLVRKVCGNSFGVGLAVPVPSIKEVKHLSLPMNGTVWLLDKHEVRIVSCMPTQQDVDVSKSKRCIDTVDHDESYRRPCKLRCSYRRVNMRHLKTKRGVWELMVQAQFVKVKGGLLAVRKAQGMFLNDGAVSDVESEDISVGVGDCICIGNYLELFTDVVDSIDENGVVCYKEVTNDTGEAVYISLEEANERYNKYIRY